jgi:hypothetical protein
MIAEHEPDKLYAKKGHAQDEPEQLHNFAATKGLGSPKAPKPRRLSPLGHSFRRKRSQQHHLHCRNHERKRLPLGATSRSSIRSSQSQT